MPNEEDTPRRRPPQPSRRTNPIRRGPALVRTIDELRQSWLVAAWLDLFPEVASAVEPAGEGYTRSFGVEPGRIGAQVQDGNGHMSSASISVPMYTDEQWDRATGALSEQAVFAARLPEGIMPQTIEPVLAEAGLALVPDHVTPRCTCKRRAAPWCVHVHCLALLIAQRLYEEPLLIFTLRGMRHDLFLERLRERRAIVGDGRASGGVYSPRIPHVSDLPPVSFESRAHERFWEMDPALETLDLLVDPPQVSHPLLRRLGTSPFAQGKFPLVGLLATCYELISDAVTDEEVRR